MSEAFVSWLIFVAICAAVAAAPYLLCFLMRILAVPEEEGERW